MGFIQQTDTTAGNDRWLTVVSPEGPNEVELVLELNQNPAAKTNQETIFRQGMSSTMFFVNDIQKESQRLKALGVNFTMDQQGPQVQPLQDSTTPLAT